MRHSASPRWLNMGHSTHIDTCYTWRRCQHQEEVGAGHLWKEEGKDYPLGCSQGCWLLQYLHMQFKVRAEGLPCITTSSSFPFKKVKSFCLKKLEKYLEYSSRKYEHFVVSKVLVWTCGLCSEWGHQLHLAREARVSWPVMPRRASSFWGPACWGHSPRQQRFCSTA